jgi:hypothetical protein
MKSVAVGYIVACVGAVLALGVTGAWAADEPLVGQWRYFPVAAGTPDEPLPPPEELLKVVPPLRTAPAFSPEAQALGVATWWADYSQPLFAEQPPTAVDLARPPVLRTCPGEDEPLALALWSISRTGSVTLSVKESPFPVTLRRLEFAPRYLPTPYRGVQVEGGRVVGLATYMPEEGTAEMRPGENTVFWINLAVPLDAKPGDYPVTLNLTVHQVQEIALTTTVTVLPFTLPRADVAYGMYFRWAGPKESPRYGTPEFLRTYWRDLARHGMTSVSFYQYTASGDFIDEAGKPKALDGHLGIQQLQDMKADGLIHADIPIMLLSSNLSKFPEAARLIRDELKRRAMPEMLLYGWDEPPVNAEARAAFEALRPVRQVMRVTTAITDHAAAAYADLIDVWVVNAGRLTPEIRALAAEKKRELWTYDCNHRGRGNGTRARFYAGLYTWALKLRGNFHWCYTEGYSWEGDRNATFNFVLPSASGPVPSVAWENRREGVEDYRLLRFLEARLAARPEAAQAQEAGQWLAEIRARVNWDLIRDMPKSVYPWDGAEVYPMCPDFEPAELCGIRTRIIDYILALQ